MGENREKKIRDNFYTIFLLISAILIGTFAGIIIIMGLLLGGPI